MRCPECSAWTDLRETRTKPTGLVRRYECANMHWFTTTDGVVTRVDKVKRGRGRPRKDTVTVDRAALVRILNLMLGAHPYIVESLAPDALYEEYVRVVQVLRGLLTTKEKADETPD